MRGFFYDLQVDNKPILLPDNEISVELVDLEHEDSGRDEQGYQHRIVLRKDMKSIVLSYGTLTVEEFRYMESLFSGKNQFQVSYSNLNGRREKFTAFKRRHGITFRNNRVMVVKNYKITLVEC